MTSINVRYFLPLGLAYLLAGLAPKVSAQTVVNHDATGDRSVEVSNQPVTTPVITGQPQTLLGQVGGTYQFSVTATGQNLSYQWYKDSTTISGATLDVLTLANAQSGDFSNHASATALYSVKITNGAGTATSNLAGLYLDTNGNGLPDWWQTQYFGALGQSPYADPDNDGMNNVQEYLVGTNPTQASSVNYTLVTTGPVSVQPLQNSYPVGTGVGLAVTGALLQNWTGDASGSVNPLNVPMTRNKSIQAVTTDFANAHFPITLSTGVGAAIRALLVQSNGQIVAGGTFDTFLGSPQWNLGRINADGTLDTTFFTGSQSHFQNTVYDMVQQADGKVIVVGNFYHATPFSMGANPPNYIARLNVDGTLDESFMATGPFPDSYVYAVALQSDGHILIAGNFINIGSTSSRGLARLNSDGTLDTSFAVGSGLSGTTASGCLQIDSSGNIYVGGSFSQYNGTNVSNLIRVKSTGALDTTFSTGTGFNSTITALTLRSSGGAYVGGYFTQYQGTTAREIVALTDTGAIDSSFTAGSASSSGSVNQIAVQPDGKLLLACSSTFWQGQNRGYALRLNSSGSVDTSFAPQINGQLYKISLTGSGKILVGGFFTTINNQARCNLAQLNADGSLDTPYYNVGTASGLNNLVSAQQADGKILVSGNFTLAGNAPVSGFVRLNSNGSLDSTFTPGTGPNSIINSIVPLPSGKIVIGGSFVTYNGSSARYCAQLNSDGTLDTTFAGNIGTGPDNIVFSVAAQSNGQIILAGVFSNVNSQPHARLARLNANGTVDSNFNAATDQIVYTVASDSLGKILIGGSFTTVDNQSINYFARLSSNGSVDPSFNPPLPNGTVNQIALSPFGQIVIRGSFTQVGSTNQAQLARYSSTGTLDPIPGQNGPSSINSVGVQADGGIVLALGSSFTSGGITYPYLYRLNPSGLIDPLFNPKHASAVNNVLISARNDIYAFGSFKTDLSEYAAGIARYSSAPNLNIIFGGISPTGSVTAGTPITLYGTATTSSGTLTGVDFLYSTDAINFQIASAGANQGNGLWTGVWAPPAAGTYYLRMTAADTTGESATTANLTYTATSGSPQIASPTLNIGTGSYTSPQSVAVSSSTPGVQIFYTTDGSDPASSSTRMFLGTGGTIAISQTTTLNIQSFYGNGSSTKTTATYTINTPPPMVAEGEPLPGWIMPVLAGLLVYFASRRKTRLAL